MHRKLCVIGSRFRKLYGSGPLHLVVLLACFALAASVVLVLGPANVLNTDVWWQSIGVWFLGSAILVDLVLLPLSALADKSLLTVLRVRRKPLRHKPDTLRRGPAPVINYLRVPVLASGLLFLLFFPGVIKQGESSYVAATGQSQDPFLERWLVLAGVFFGLSALIYILTFAAARLRNDDRLRHDDKS